MLTLKVKTLDDMPYMQNVFSRLDDERRKLCLLIGIAEEVKSLAILFFIFFFFFFLDGGFI